MYTPTPLGYPLANLNKYIFLKDLFPHADRLVEYLQDFADKLKLNIAYNTRVKKISKTKQDGAQFFILETQDGNTYQADCVLMATGVVGENVPSESDIPGMGLFYCRPELLSDEGQSLLSNPVKVMCDAYDYNCHIL